MNRITSILIFIAVAIAFASCAKERSDSTYESSNRALQAWLRKYYPDAVMSGRGIYLLDSIPGTGERLTDTTTYAFLEFTLTDLYGNYIESTDEDINKQIGSFKQAYYFGPKVFIRKAAQTYAGLEDMMDIMRIGGQLRAVIPSWLISTAIYDTAEEYQRQDQGGGHYIYDIRLVGATPDIMQWQNDSLKSYSKKYFNGIDTTKAGFYYNVVRKGPGDTIAKDSTVYIRYIGRLLNGHVFDTNIKDTAKRYGIYDSAKKYEASEVKMASEAANIKMDGSTTIPGFSEALFRIKADEKIVTFFNSDFGYGSAGSGMTVPGFAPLRFDIEIVKKDS